MAQELPYQQHQVHVLGTFEGPIGAAWRTLGIAGTDDVLTKFGGGVNTLTAHRAVVFVSIKAHDDNANDVYVVTSNPGVNVPPGAGMVRLEAGQSINASVYGSGWSVPGSTPICWLYGAAGNPKVTVFVGLAGQ